MTIKRHEPAKLYSKAVEANGFVFTAGITAEDPKQDAKGQAQQILACRRLRQIKHAASCGQSAAVRSGVIAARAPLIATLDGDGQNDPSFIPALLHAFEQGGARIGLVAGQRVGRRSGAWKKVQSRIANGVRGAILRDGTRDSGCGLKVFRRDAFLALPYFDECASIAARFPNVYLALSGVLALYFVRRKGFLMQMGQLLAEVGADKLLWGSEAALMGCPQPYLDALWALQIPEELQDDYGFPEITNEDKRKILGTNFARLMGVEVPQPSAGRS